MTSSIFRKHPIAIVAAALCAAFALAAPDTARADQRATQVLLETAVVEVETTRIEQLGVDWKAALGSPTARAGRMRQQGVQPTSGGQSGAPLVQLRGLQQRGIAQILAEPRLTALDGQSVTILLGNQLPSVDTPIPADADVADVPFGIQLQLTPTIRSDGLIDFDVSTEVARILGTPDAPVISNQRITTEVQVLDGQSVVLAGLLDQQTRIVGRGVPILSQVPQIGTLFQNLQVEREERDLLVFVTPTLLDSNGNPISGGGGAPLQTDSSPTLAPKGTVYGDVGYFGVATSYTTRPGFPLVTQQLFEPVDNPQTGSPFAGELSSPDVEVVYDESEAMYPFQAGLQAEVGGWFGPDQAWGFELNGLWVPEARLGERFGSGADNRFLSVPFFNTETGIEQAIVIGSNLAFGNEQPSAGLVDIESSREFHGVGANVKKTKYQRDDFRLDASLGFRWFHIGEDFSINYRSDPIPNTQFAQRGNLGSYLFAGGNVPGAGSVVTAEDLVEARNDFYGLDIGVDATFAPCDCMELKVSPSIALGANVQYLDTSGWGRAVDPNGFAWETHAGVFARPGVTGSRTRTEFAVVPEIGIDLLFRLYEGLRLRIGYDFMYVNNIVSAGDQLTRNLAVQTGQFNSFQQPATAAGRPFETDDFFAHGLQVSVRYEF